MWGVYCNDFSWGLSWNPLNQNNFIFFVSQIAKNCFVTSGIFYEYFGEFNSPISCRISTKQSGVFLFYNKTCNKRIENTIFRKIYTRNNAVKVYESISGHTDKNGTSSWPGIKYGLFQLFILPNTKWLVNKSIGEYF